ncbi:phosphohydrolase [Stutzerimonas kirkiae]|uniref:Phosphohydrolase n=2 Tax=Stutzerimonas kirkiae TaxID=2211392 RepID=A0A4Q9R287_9GAMM|nr:HD domain-containing protein [Stutzerimonas kirkiae]TBU93334.1 phosphohydrolase [Stutzerimonas kirkiae]TBV01468.1 phosphohydrolase [Stutzerimonas kirkiae]TBV06908.1 phosphohydrolase [Stutzerimonas kirkiae]TBV10409.1 phosphohydrolase [Stutzerimonas kirkiae]
MNQAELAGVLDFLRGAEQLKNTLRTSRTSNGRHESTAEHTWRLCLMILLFGKQYPDVDILRLMKICIVHDLGEAISGDIAAVDQVEGVDKGVEERKDLELLARPLPDDLREEILMLWDEYDSASSRESLLAKAFDKIETILQHTQGSNPPGFDYGFNLSYGRKYTDYDDLTRTLRALVDKDTKVLAGKNRAI